MEAVSTSETSVDLYETTRHDNTEGRRLQRYSDLILESGTRVLVLYASRWKERREKNVLRFLSVDVRHAVNCSSLWSQVLSSSQLRRVNAAWHWDGRQGTVHLIVIVIDIWNRMVEGANEQKLHAYKEDACRKGDSACVLFPRGWSVPWTRACVYTVGLLRYQLPSLSGLRDLCRRPLR
jgi:hypothetical protein